MAKKKVEPKSKWEKLSEEHKAHLAMFGINSLEAFKTMRQHQLTDEELGATGVTPCPVCDVIAKELSLK